MRPDISILGFSGGIDSTYVLKYLLTETNDTVIAHHVHMVNHENRWREESEACNKIVDHCKSQYRDFHYTESTVDRRELKAFGYDINTSASELGAASHNAVLLTGKYPDNAYFGMNTDEMGSSTTGDISEMHVNLIMMVCCYPQKAPQYKRHPLLSKADSMAYLGSDLLEMCWTCRRPLPNQQECGTCKTCIEIDRIRKDKTNAGLLQ